MHSPSKKHEKVATHLKKLLHLGECEKKGWLHGPLQRCSAESRKIKQLVLIGRGFVRHVYKITITIIGNKERGNSVIILISQTSNIVRIIFFFSLLHIETYSTCTVHWFYFHLDFNVVFLYIYIYIFTDDSIKSLCVLLNEHIL